MTSALIRPRSDTARPVSRAHGARRIPDQDRPCSLRVTWPQPPVAAAVTDGRAAGDLRRPQAPGVQAPLAALGAPAVAGSVLVALIGAGCAALGGNTLPLRS